MKHNISWTKKYRLAMQETLSIKEIMELRSIGQPSAIEIRKKALEYCLKNNIAISSKRILTEVVLLVTNYSLTYYYEKMKMEEELLCITEKRDYNYVNS